ncbi:nitrate reductase molybdenum cofactor assembly chaperone [Weizmannia coagulans]|jgi:nitrate reductase delta subunit|uniref:Nitrate reductase molybdenum cofactor assembly chaperone n=2 Tax=Heyndrickxia TaxID=2837504 RepID=A0A0C5C3W9_HEYCO|nr:MULTISPECIES: nitrate reductase molybdenum cofactor assembly chaperone [Heyndrickxia]AJO21471.1 nitrate reductase molybdenum cofactor assembly chaperone [Heyndrickxia coagulans]AKN52904.1 Respiratory nitrate reductase delta chain [Heyndrickxia coagulans]APB37304.1 nitrate reductase molybdenum cofactor assembly chaperone [Heyndrickxia coagulans]ATW82044.1 nitrate reductase molybdenum cofactor assembly chaperone [Heyndrickxia coagulans]KGB29477.1 nitrate reductase [Heyndrickxia coagulans]
MNDREKLMLAIASRMLTYPTETLYEEKEAVIAAAKETGAALEKAAAALFCLPLSEIQSLYVSTFDLQEKNGLYLTYHEFGDSPKRGAAFIKLQKMINEAGFERNDGELADYIPMLFEFLAVSEPSRETERLCKRLAYAVQRIAGHLSEESLYMPVFSVLMEQIFEQPSKEEIEALEQQREKADLENLPYPIMY